MLLPNIIYAHRRARTTWSQSLLVFSIRDSWPSLSSSSSLSSAYTFRLYKMFAHPLNIMVMNIIILFGFFLEFRIYLRRQTTITTYYQSQWRIKSEIIEALASGPYQRDRLEMWGTRAQRSSRGRHQDLRKGLSGPKSGSTTYKHGKIGGRQNWRQSQLLTYALAYYYIVFLLDSPSPPKECSNVWMKTVQLEFL